MAAALYNGAARGVLQQARHICRKQLSEIHCIKKNRCSTKAADSKSLTEQQQQQTQVHKLQQEDHASLANSTNPSYLQRRILVHFKYYDSFEAIPERVSWPMMNRAMSQYRIKASMVMMGTTAVLFFMICWYGKTTREKHNAEDFHARRLSYIQTVHKHEQGEKEK